VILPPSAGRWRAVAGGQTYGDYNLSGLLDQLDEVCRDVPEDPREG